MEKISVDHLFNLTHEIFNSTSKIIYFISAIDTSVLGFLFTQAIIGNLTGLGIWMVLAWGAFGISFLLSLLVLWSIFHSQSLLLEYLAAAKNYSDNIEINPDESADLIKTVGDGVKNEFLRAESKLINYVNSKKIKLITPIFIWFHILTYLFSIVVGAGLICVKSGTQWNMKQTFVQQSPAMISPDNNIEIPDPYLNQLKVVPASSPDSLLAPIPTSPVPESNPAQTQQSTQ